MLYLPFVQTIVSNLGRESDGSGPDLFKLSSRSELDLLIRNQSSSDPLHHHRGLT